MFQQRNCFEDDGLLFLFTFSPLNSPFTKRPGGGQEHPTKARESTACGPAKENTTISSEMLRTLVLAHEKTQVGESFSQERHEKKAWEGAMAPNSPVPGEECDWWFGGEVLN